MSTQITIGSYVTSYELCRLLRCHNQNELFHRHPELEQAAEWKDGGRVWKVARVKELLGSSGIVERALGVDCSLLDDERDEADEFERTDDDDDEADPGDELLDRAAVEAMLGGQYDDDRCRTYLLKYVVFTDAGMRWYRSTINFYWDAVVGLPPPSPVQP